MKTLFTHFPNITTERLELRALFESDAPEVFVLRSDERILRYIESPSAKSQQEALEFIQKVISFFENGESIMWAICYKGEEKLIGTICLWNYNLEKSTVEIGYTLHPDYWGRGLVSEAIAAVNVFAFNEIQANLVDAYVQPDNLASIAVLQKNGYLKTGELDNYHVFKLCKPPLNEIVMETERLKIREISALDAPFLLELLNTPDWIQNIGDREVRTIENARNYAITRMVLNYRQHGFGFYLMESKADGSAMGMCGLVKRDFLDDMDIGYALLPQYYGKGYAYEAAKAVFGFAKNSLKIRKLAAITIESNKPSIKLLLKLGLRFEKKFHAPNDDEELMLFGAKL